VVMEARIIPKTRMRGATETIIVQFEAYEGRSRNSRDQITPTRCNYAFRALIMASNVVDISISSS